MRNCFLLLSLFATMFTSTTSHSVEVPQSAKKDLKILVLIIASETLPIHVELHKIWRSYMHADPEHVEVYFIKGDPNLDVPCEIIGDTVWSKCEENMIPGILYKTVLSLEHFLPRIGTEFDYVLRTNLSSFYIFPRLLDYLKQQPKDNLYLGVKGGFVGWEYVAGSGFIMSPDIVEKIVSNKAYFFNYPLTVLDDLVIGEFLINSGVKITPQEQMLVTSIEGWNESKQQIPADIFQFRVQMPNRVINDIMVHTELLNRFYPQGNHP